MLTSKKHAKSPPEKPIKKVTKLTHSSTFDSLMDTDDESETTKATESNIHKPKIIENTSRRIKITYKTTIEDVTYHLKHVELLKYIIQEKDSIMTIYNKRHEILRAPALDDLKNIEIYKNHFDCHQVVYGKNQDQVLYTIIQDFTSQLKIHEIKNQRNLIPFLKQHNLRITDHEWTSDIWNTRLIGFLPAYAPTYFPKEYVYQRMIEITKGNSTVPEFRLKHIRLSNEVLGRHFTVNVYAIEVKNTDYIKANKVFLQSAESADEYVSFRTQKVNEKAFKNAIALVAQIQDDSRSIVIENVSEEAFFIYDSQLKQQSEFIGYYHLPQKSKIYIVVQLEDYQTVRKRFQSAIIEWNEMLDPSDTRYTGSPRMVPINSDEYSSSSDLSSSINSLLSIDLTTFTVFTPNTTTTSGASPEPRSDITFETYAATIEMQNAKIEKQEAQIELLITTIKNLNDDMNRKLERMLEFITTPPIDQTTPSEDKHDISGVPNDKNHKHINDHEENSQSNPSQPIKPKIPKKVVGTGNRRLK
jgi:hypothetical protein